MLSRRSSVSIVSRCFRISRNYSTQKEEQPLYLNPHKWQGLPADRIFELHDLRQKVLADKYVPDDAERSAVLSTYVALGITKPTLDYVYEIDNFKERVMNNTPVPLRGLPPKLSNVPVIDKGVTPHKQRKLEQLTRVMAYEMPLLAKFRQEYKPKPSSESPIKLTYHSDMTDESNGFNRKVVLTCKLEDLQLNDQQARKFKILSGNKFDHNKDTIKFSSSRFPEAAQNARWLVETFNKLLTESKDLSKDTFEDIPVDTRHNKPQKSAAAFPEEWKRPQDAPVEQNKIIRKLVDGVKQLKDEKFVSKIAP